MNGPSLEAIRKFKELQAKKKEEEKLKFNESKLSTLEHRAAQGDKKAKRQLKLLEQAKVDQDAREAREAARREKERERQIKTNIQPVVKKEKEKETRKDLSFEELMQIAKKNKNIPTVTNPDKPTIKKTKQQPTSLVTDHQKSINSSNVVKAAQPSSSIKVPVVPVTPKIPADQARATFIKASQQPKPTFIKNSQQPRHTFIKASQQPKPTFVKTSQQPRPTFVKTSQQPRPTFIKTSQQPRGYIHHRRGYNDYDEDEDEDEYDDLDDFIDDGDGDDESQLELSKTLRSVFGYDKHKYARREALLDAQAEREYRSIGKVSNFEDLEREERRSAKLAAAEDRKAEREEEERRARKLKLKSRG